MKADNLDTYGLYPFDSVKLTSASFYLKYFHLNYLIALSFIAFLTNHR